MKARIIAIDRPLVRVRIEYDGIYSVNVINPMNDSFLTEGISTTLLSSDPTFARMIWGRWYEVSWKELLPIINEGKLV
jgi:hypothetical protein